MRLLDLEVEHFGVFNDRHWDLGQRGLHLICGENEAGKSTLLQLIREVLFGFPARSPYQFASHAGEMAATVRAQLADGRELRFRRRKGRAGLVTGQLDDGRPIDEEGLSELLDGANAELFGSVFAFSLDELAKGRDSLKDTRLAEALYGGAMGGLGRFQSLNASLDQELKELFSPSNRASKPKINALLKRIDELDEQLRETAFRPDVYEARRARCEECERRQEETQGRVERLRARRDACRRRLEAAQPRRELAEVEAELERFGPLPSLSREQWQGVNELRAELARVDQELAKLGEDRDRQRQQLEDLRPDPILLGRQTQIALLQQDLGRIHSGREQAPAKQRERATLEQAIRQRLARLHPDWTLDDLERVSLDPEQTRRLRTLADELSAFEPRRLQWDEETRRIEEELCAADREAPAEESAWWDRLDALLEREAEYLAARRQLDSLSVELERRAAQADATRRALARRADPAVDTLPSLADAQALADDWERGRQAGTTEQVAAERLRAELHKAEQQRQRLGQDAPPDRQELLELRAGRDEAWGMLRAHFIEGRRMHQEIRDRFFCDPQDLADRYAALVAGADDAADRRQESADEARALDRVIESLVSLRGETARTEERVRECVEQQEGVAERWRRLWRPSGIEPAEPTAMCDWLRRAHAWREEQRTLEELLARRDAARGEVEAFEAEAGTLLEARQEEAPAEQRVERLRTLRRERSRQLAQSELLRQRRPQLQQRLAEVRQELATLEQRRGPAGVEWRQLCDLLALPADWSQSQVLAALGELAEARAERTLLRTTEQQLDAFAAELNEFQGRVERAAADTVLASNNVERSPEQTVHLLVRRLEEARKGEERAHLLEEALTAAERRIDELGRRRDELSRQLQSHVAGRDGEDEAAMREALDAWRRHDELRQRAEALRREVQAALGSAASEGPDLDPTRLRGARTTHSAKRDGAIGPDTEDASLFDDEDTPELLADLERQLQSAERDHRIASQDAGAARAELRQVDGSDKGAEVALQRESALAELTASVDRWAPLELARALMTQAIDRFERQEQPALLADVALLLRRMTDGRYVNVQRQLDKDGTLQVVDVTGQARRADQLSTGTREQLYLAIRLAYVRHYCRRAEPLPIVMDDVLVNFDEPRARRTLEVLVELAADLQVVFLTCHRSMARLVEQVQPGTPAILLTTDPQDSLDAWRFAGAPPARTSRRRVRSADDEQPLFSRHDP